MSSPHTIITIFSTHFRILLSVSFPPNSPLTPPSLPATAPRPPFAFLFTCVSSNAPLPLSRSSSTFARVRFFRLLAPAPPPLPFLFSAACGVLQVVDLDGDSLARLAVREDCLLSSGRQSYIRGLYFAQYIWIAIDINDNDYC